MPDSRDVVIVGGGGHAVVLFDAIRLAAAANVLGYVAPAESMLSSLGVPWLGDDKERSSLAARGVRRAVLGMAGVKSNQRRSEIFDIAG